MPTYGPWVEPTEHLETIRLSPTLGVVVTGDVRSGIVFDEGRIFRKAITRGRTVGGEPSVVASSDTWAELIDLPLEDLGTEIGGVDAYVEHAGSHEYFVVGDFWYQTDSWEVRGGTWDIWQSANPTLPTLPPGAIDIEWDGGTRQPPTLLELTVEQITADIPQWGVRYAAEGHVGEDFGAGLSLSELMHGGWPGWDGVGAHTWTEDELATVQALLTPTSTGRPSRSDARWPALAFAWSGGYPGSDPTTELAHGPYSLDYASEPMIEMRVRFLRQGYRFVFPGTPIRRTFPREDGLAGGAGRTWPASKAQQSSGRTFGGYL